MSIIYINPFQFAAAPPSGYDPDAQAYITAVEAADGQALEIGVANAVNDFVTGCKADGNWAAFRSCYLLSGARTLAGALIALVGENPLPTGFLATDYNRKNGLSTGPGRWLNTGVVDNSLPQNSFHMSLYGTFVNASIFNSPAGVYANSNNYSVLYQVLGSLYHGNRKGGAAFIASSGGGPTFFGTSRSSATGYSARAKLTSFSYTATSLTPSSLVHAACGVNNSGSFSPTGTGQVFSFYSIGESLDLALLEARVSTLMSDLAAAIP